MASTKSPHHLSPSPSHLKSSGRPILWMPTIQPDSASLSWAMKNATAHPSALETLPDPRKSSKCSAGFKDSERQHETTLPMCCSALFRYPHTEVPWRWRRSRGCPRTSGETAAADQSETPEITEKGMKNRMTVNDFAGHVHPSWKLVNTKNNPMWKPQQPRWKQTAPKTEPSIKSKSADHKTKTSFRALSGALKRFGGTFKCQTFTSKYKVIFSETFEPLCSTCIWNLYVEPFNLDVEPWSKTFMWNQEF